MEAGRKVAPPFLEGRSCEARTRSLELGGSFPEGLGRLLEPSERRLGGPYPARPLTGTVGCGGENLEPLPGFRPLAPKICSQRRAWGSRTPPDCRTRALGFRVMTVKATSMQGELLLVPRPSWVLPRPWLC